MGQIGLLCTSTYMITLNTDNIIFPPMLNEFKTTKYPNLDESALYHNQSCKLIKCIKTSSQCHKPIFELPSWNNVLWLDVPSGIRNQIVALEGENTDHLTSTTANQSLTYCLHYTNGINCNFLVTTSLESITRDLKLDYWTT